MRTLLATLLVAAGAASAEAAPIVMTFDLTPGFDVSVDGGAAAPTGQLVFDVEIDNATPDLNPMASRGRFVTTAIRLTAPGLGFAGALVTAPSPLYVDTFPQGLTIIGDGSDPDIGWNGSPAPSAFMADVNDLSTLPVGISFVIDSLFFYGGITLQDGTTLEAFTGDAFAEGVFSVREAGAEPVTEPTALALLGLGILGIAVIRHRRS